MKRLRIGEMAEACGVSTRALRLYQKEGIIEPRWVDEDSGYRSYAITQAIKVDMVTQLRAAGFTLQDIADIERAKNISYLAERARIQGEELEEQIRQLQLKKRINDELTQSCRQYLDRSCCERIMLERLPERTILALDAPTPADVRLCDGYSRNECWEWYQLYAKRRLTEAGYPPELFRRVGCYVPCGKDADRCDLLQSQPFVFVDDIASVAEDRTVALAGGMYLTVYYDVCHAADGEDLDAGRIASLLTYARDHDYRVVGPFILENICRYMRFFNEDDHSYYRYCLAVTD